MQKLPTRYSEKHHETIIKARQLYNEKKYQETIALLLPAQEDEPNNLFILNDLARSMYWVEHMRPESFKYYRKLVDLIDSRHKSDEHVVVIDLWFAEAYWKLGTLYLDRHEYERAAYEITKAIVAGIDNAPFIYEQALSYLTEAYFYIGDYELAKYFYYQALSVNPKNKYVLKYMELLKDK